jgi:hypothetical protein
MRFKKNIKSQQYKFSFKKGDHVRIISSKQYYKNYIGYINNKVKNTESKTESNTVIYEVILDAIDKSVFCDESEIQIIV